MIAKANITKKALPKTSQKQSRHPGSTLIIRSWSVSDQALAQLSGKDDRLCYLKSVCYEGFVTLAVMSEFAEGDAG